MMGNLIFFTRYPRVFVTRMTKLMRSRNFSTLKLTLLESPRGRRKIPGLSMKWSSSRKVLIKSPHHREKRNLLPFEFFLVEGYHRLCPSRFPPLFFVSSRHPAQRNVSIPIPPACTCQHANWCKRYLQTSLKMDRKHFVLLSNKRKYTGNKNLKAAMKCRGSK